MAADMAAEEVPVAADLAAEEVPVAADMVEVEVLARHVELHAAVAVGNGQAGLGSEEGRVLGAELVVADDDHLGFSTGGVDIAVADSNVADETAAGKSIDGTGQ